MKYTVRLFTFLLMLAATTPVMMARLTAAGAFADAPARGST